LLERAASSMEVYVMNGTMRRRLAAAGAAVVLALAVVGSGAAVALAAGTPAAQPVTTQVAAQVSQPSTFHPGKGPGAVRPNLPPRSAASIVGAIAVTLVTVGVVTFLMLSLDRRSTAPLRAVEGGLAPGASPPSQGESGAEERRQRKAA